MSHIQRYYLDQAGAGGGEFFAGSRFQRGSGLANFFRNLTRGILPILGSAGKSILQQFAQTGLNVARDLQEGKKFKESVSERLDEAGTNLNQSLKRKLGGEQSGSGAYKRKRGEKKTQSRRAPRRSQSRAIKKALYKGDIFAP